MIHDLRTAFRSLSRAPGFALVAIATLALGIGGAAGIFSLVNTLLFRPLPFPEEDRLVRMRDEVARPGGEPWRYNTSPRSFVALRAGPDVFQGVVAQRYRPATLSAPGEPARVIGIGVSDRWSEVLGVGPVLGRTFTPEEARLGRESRAALLGHALWQSRFGGDPAVLGRAIRLDDRVYTVVGVMPRGYNYPYGAELWVPDTFDADDTAFGPYVVGRLADGVSMEEAQGRLDAYSGVLAEEYPDSHRSIRLLAVPLRDDLVSNHPRLGIALLLGSGVLLLLACFNIGTLLLVRAEARRGERGVRAALGAGAGRQAREQLLESLLLGVTGGGLGLVVAVGLHSLIGRLGVAPDSSLGGFLTDLRLDWRVAAFAAALSVATAVLFGALPAIRAARTQPRDTLADAGRSGGRGRPRWVEGLVAAELAVALVLLAGASLMMENLLALRGGDRGYETADRVAFELAMPASRLPAPEDRVRFLAEVMASLRSEPGVRAVGASHHLPMDDGSSSTAFSVEGGPSTAGERRLLANLRIVAGDYLDALDVPLVAGRGYTADELRERRDVVLVNRSFAERYWPDGDALGGRIKLGPLEAEGSWLSVVGVVADVDENLELAETLYVPYPRAPSPEMAMVVHIAGGAAGPVREAVRRVDPGQPLGRLSSLDQRLADVLGQQTAATRLMAAFAVFGLLLAGLGIYGVLAFSVRARRRELAVRQALGLTPAGAVTRVLRRSLMLALAGIGLGLPGAVLFTGLLSDVLGGSAGDVSIDVRLLAEHARLDPLAYAVLGAALAAAVLLAAAGPALRAVDSAPAATLRGSG